MFLYREGRMKNCGLNFGIAETSARLMRHTRAILKI
jgi:hypothetical protein